MKHLELFSGIGGFRRAMELLSEDRVLSFQSIGYSEIDPKALMTYRKNFRISDNEISMGDIVSFTSQESSIRRLPFFDLLSGGFPCQTFSMMGKQAGFSEERGQMFFRIIDILSVCRPKYILLENVRNLITHDKGRTISTIRNELEKLGYKVFIETFNTSDFHLPQNRNRVLIFGTTEDVPIDFIFSASHIASFFTKRVKNTSTLVYDNVCDVLSKRVPEKYFLSERIKPTLLADGSASFQSKSDINQMVARPLTASMHKMHRACQDNYYSQDFIDSDGEINPVATMSKDELAQLPIRKLTPEEAFMFQGFPASFASEGRNNGVSDSALYKQAGNAVSVNVVYAVLRYLIENNIIRE